MNYVRASHGVNIDEILVSIYDLFFHHRVCPHIVWTGQNAKNKIEFYAFHTQEDFNPVSYAVLTHAR